MNTFCKTRLVVCTKKYSAIFLFWSSYFNNSFTNLLTIPSSINTGFSLISTSINTGFSQISRRKRELPKIQVYLCRDLWRSISI